MTMNEWTVCKDAATLIIGASAAWFGLRSYAKNATTRRAEFLVDLHKGFFVEQKYKSIRLVLDSEDEAAIKQRAGFIRDEPEDFIEFLNFFELVAYLNHGDNISFTDVEALLGYYLRLLIREADIRAYIRDTKRNDFEHLNALLDKISKAD